MPTKGKNDDERINKYFPYKKLALKYVPYSLVTLYIWHSTLMGPFFLYKKQKQNIFEKIDSMYLRFDECLVSNIKRPIYVEFHKYKVSI